MINELNEKACKTTENSARIWQIEKLFDKMNVSHDKRDYGITATERFKCIEMIKTYRKRMEKILAEEIPVPDSDVMVDDTLELIKNK